MAEKKEKAEENVEVAEAAESKSAEEKETKKDTEGARSKAKASSKGAKGKVTTDIIEAVKNMTVLELSELVKELEEVFGVTAAAPVMAAAGPGAAAAGAGLAAAEEEKSAFDVILSSVGDKKIQVIKVVRSLTGLGLKEAKAVVDEAPKPVKEQVTKDEAEKMKKELEEAGATIELK